MASQFSIKLSVSAADLIKSIQNVIENEINKNDALKRNPINISVNQENLIDNIKKAINATNKALSSEDNKAKIAVDVDSGYFIKSVSNAIKSFNQQAENKPTVKLTTDLDITAALKKLQNQLAKNNITSVNIGSENVAKATANAAVNDTSATTYKKSTISEKAAETAAINALTTAIRNEAQAHKELSSTAIDSANAERQKKAVVDNIVSSIKNKTQAEQEYIQLTLDDYVQSLEKEKQQEAAIKNATNTINEQNKVVSEGNELLKQRTSYMGSEQVMPISRYTTYGDAFKKTTYREDYDLENNKWFTVSNTVVESAEKMQKANAKVYDTLNKLSGKLDEIRAKYMGAIGDKGIDQTSEAFKRLETEGQNIANMFDKITESSGVARDKLISDAEAAIKKYDLMARQAQNEQYVATSLRTRPISTVKDIEINNLDKIKSKAAETHIPVSLLADDFKRLASELSKVNDKDGLVNYLNDLDIVKSKIEALTPKFKQIDKIKSGTTADLSTLRNYRKLGTELILNDGNAPSYVKEINKQMAELNTRIDSAIDKNQRLRKSVKDTNTADTISRKYNEQEQLHQETVEIEKSTEALKKKAEMANKAYESLSKNYAAVTGTDRKNPVADTAALSEMQKMYTAIENEIAKATKLDGEAAVQAINNVNNRIDGLKRLVETYKEYEYVGGKDINSLKSIAQSNVAKLGTDISGKGLLTGDLVTQFKELQVLSENITDANSFAQYKTKLDEVTAAFKLAVSRASQLEKVLNSVDTSLSKLGSARGLVNSSVFGTNFGDMAVNSLNMQITELTNKLNTMKTAMANAKSPETIQENINSYKEVKEQVVELFNAVNQLNKLSGANTDLNKLYALLNQAVFKQNGANQEVVNLNNSLTDLKNKYRSFLTEAAKDISVECLKKSSENFEKLKTDIDKTINSAKELKNQLSQDRMDSSFAKQQQQLIAGIDDYVRKNSKAMNAINGSTGNTFGVDFENLKQSAMAADAPIKQLSDQVAILKAQIKSAGLEGTTFFGELTEKAVKFVKWTGMTLAITKARMYFRKLFTTVYELDTALIDLKKTFQGTDEELNQFYYDSNRLAKQLGVTTKEIIEQGAAWSRLGYSSKESMEKMAEMSSMFASISPDMNTEQATNGLVSIMKAFDIDPENVLDGILSKVNIIGNTAATSNGEIVEMLQKSSAAMREANNTLEETIALETAAVEITRDSASVGTAYKTISARLRGLDEETLEVIDDTEILTGKFAEATKTINNPGGLSLFTDSSKQTFKSTYQIIKELKTIWDDLSDAQHAKIEDIVGGKRQLQIVAASISNFKAAEKALDNMANSAGSAEAEMETVRNSAAYAMNELKETFTALAQDSVSRDFLKNLIKTGTGALEVINNLVKAFGALPTAIGIAAGAITAFKRKGKGLFGYNDKGNLTFWGAEATKGIKSWYKEKTDPTGEKASAKLQIKNEIQAVKDFDNAIKTNQMNLRTYNAVMQSSNDNVKRYGRAVMQGTDNVKAFNTVNKQLKKELKQVGKNANVAADGTKQLSAGMKLLNTISSMLVSMGISFAISKFIELIATAINWADKYNEKSKEFAEQAKSIKSQIEDLDDELATTKLRIDALNKLEHPTIIQQEELDKLIATNEELERLKKSLQAQEKDAANQAADATVEWWKTIYYGGIGEGYKDPGDWLLHFLPRLWSGTKKDIEKESYSSFLNAISEYKELQDEIAEKQKEMSETTDESYIIKLQDQISGLEDKLRDAESIAEHNYASWTAKLGTLNLDIPEQKEIYDKMNELIYYWEYFSGKIKKTLAEIVDDPNYAVVKQHLIDLWRQGKLTEDEFNKITEETVIGINAFKQALADNGYEDFAEILLAINQYFEDTVDTSNNAAKAIRNFADMLDLISENIDDFISKQEKLVEAFKKIELGGKLAREEVYELVKDMPTLAKYLTETADGWVISSKNFSNASKENIEAEKQELQSRIDTIKSHLETLGMAKTLGNQVKYSYDDPLLQAEYENALKKARGLYGALDISSDDEIDKAFDDLSDELNGLLFLLDLVDSAFDKHSIALDGLKERYDEVKSEISDFNKQIQTVDSAIKTLGEGSLLSYEELNELLDIDADLKYDIIGDQYSISIESLEELRKKSYETRNSRIEDIKAVVKAEISAGETEKAEYQKKIEEINKMGVTSTALEALAETVKGLDGINNELDYLYDLLKRLDGLEQDITVTDTNNSLSNDLQNQIDYYKTILDAVSAVKDRYTEVLDNEIDALEESKDALKDANDERQRELDLIEARNNLENAKKRKVYVYTESEGFKQVQDKAAVKEAEEKYRDVITDIQIAEIDKAIEEREKQKESLEQSVKDLLELEQNIQDSMAISQAMKALGLSDPSQLLSLPESVKEGIINGLADATAQKDIEDNKENLKHIAVTLDDVLANLGSNKKMADLSPDILDNVKQAAYKTAVQDFADALKVNADNMVKNVSYNNSPTLNANFNIYDANDPQTVAETVHQELNVFLTEYYNAIK